MDSNDLSDAFTMPNPFAWANDEENNGSYDTDDERPTDPRPRSQFLMAAPSQVNATAHWRPNSITWHGAAELIYGRPQHEHRLDPERPWWDMLEGDRDMMRLWDLAIQDLTPFDQMSPETRVWMLRALNEESLELLGVNTRAFQVPRRAAAPALDQSLFDPHMAMAIDWINRDHDYFDPAPFNELPSVVRQQRIQMYPGQMTDIGIGLNTRLQIPTIDHAPHGTHDHDDRSFDLTNARAEADIFPDQNESVSLHSEVEELDDWEGQYGIDRAIFQAERDIFPMAPHFHDANATGAQRENEEEDNTDQIMVDVVQNHTQHAPDYMTLGPDSGSDDSDAMSEYTINGDEPDDERPLRASPWPAGLPFGVTIRLVGADEQDDDSEPVACSICYDPVAENTTLVRTVVEITVADSSWLFVLSRRA